MDGGTGCKNRNRKFCRRKNIGIISGFLRNQESSDKVQALIETLFPPLEAVIAASSSGVDCVWTMDGDLMSSAKLTGLGRGANSNSRANFSGWYKIGRDHMGEIIAGTTGLSQFV
jgi:hypothetical protein